MKPSTTALLALGHIVPVNASRGQGEILVMLLHIKYDNGLVPKQLYFVVCTRTIILIRRIKICTESKKMDYGIG